MEVLNFAWGQVCLFYLTEAQKEQTNESVSAKLHLSTKKQQQQQQWSNVSTPTYAQQKQHIIQ